MDIYASGRSYLMFMYVPYNFRQTYFMFNDSNHMYNYCSRIVTHRDVLSQSCTYMEHLPAERKHFSYNIIYNLTENIQLNLYHYFV